MAYEVFFDGFEHYSAAADMLAYGYSAAPAGLSASGGRRSSKAVTGGGTSAASFTKLIAASTHVVAGVALKAPDRNLVISFIGATGTHASLTRKDSSGVLALAVGGVEVATSTELFPVNTFMYVELGVSVANAGGTYEARVNGSSVDWIPAGTGDTQAGATGTITSVSVQAGSSYNAGIIDDFYITYGDELAWLGDSRIDKLLLTANSTPQDWTPDTGNAWERLNAGTGYIASSTDEATSLFEFADLPYTPEAIHGLAVRSRMLKSNTNFRSACSMVKSASTESEGAELALSTDALGQLLILKQDPATAAAWTYNGIRDALVGVRVKG